MTCQEQIDKFKQNRKHTHLCDSFYEVGHTRRRKVHDEPLEEPDGWLGCQKPFLENQVLPCVQVEIDLPEYQRKRNLALFQVSHAIGGRERRDSVFLIDDALV